MQCLQRVDVDRTTLDGRDSLCRSACRGNRGDGGNTSQNRSATDRFFIEEGILPAWRVHDELDTVTLDVVHDVGAAFLDLVDALYLQAGVFQHIGRSVGCHDVEAHLPELTRK